MKQIIKQFLRKYTYPTWDGQSSDELADMLVKALKQNDVQKISKEEMLEVELNQDKKELKKVMQVDFYDRVDHDYSLSQDDELNI